MMPPTMMKLRTLDELSAVSQILPTESADGTAPTDSRTAHAANEYLAATTAGRPRPWIRFWARTFDLILAAVVFGAVLYRAGIDVTRWNGFSYVFFTLPLWAFWEAAFLSGWGSTPGKWLFHVRVTKTDGCCMSFPHALERAVAVLITGQGFGLPVVSLVAQISAWWTLKRRGRTCWDDQCDTVVRHEPIGMARLLGIILAFGVFLVMIWFAVNAPSAAR